MIGSLIDSLRIITGVSTDLMKLKTAVFQMFVWGVLGSFMLWSALFSLFALNWVPVIAYSIATGIYGTIAITHVKTALRIVTGITGSMVQLAIKAYDLGFEQSESFAPLPNNPFLTMDKS